MGLKWVDSTEKIFEIATNSGAKDCFTHEKVYEIISSIEDFYKVKGQFDKYLNDIEYSGIEWIPNSYINLKNDQNEKIMHILESLEELDDVQNTFTNASLEINT